MTIKDGENPANDIEPKPTQTTEAIDSVWKACAHGDLDKLKEFIDADPQSGNAPDEQVGTRRKDSAISSCFSLKGYYPLQWAALNNQVSAVSYLLQVEKV